MVVFLVGFQFLERARACCCDCSVDSPGLWLWHGLSTVFLDGRTYDSCSRYEPLLVVLLICCGCCCFCWSCSANRMISCMCFFELVLSLPTEKEFLQDSFWTTLPDGGPPASAYHRLLDWKMGTSCCILSL